MSDNVKDIFGTDRPMSARPKLHVDMDRVCAKLQGHFPDNMAGFIVFAVGDDGYWSLGHYVRPDGPVGARMLAGLAVVGIQEEIVTMPSCRKEIAGIPD